MATNEEKKPSKADATNADATNDSAGDTSKCGIIMPISEIDGCTEDHWEEVKHILTEAIGEAGFEGDLVSYGDETEVIHARILRNLYDNQVIVCDVSAKNPNVMFELGLRLAFDKATVVVKDNVTDYSFDTSPIDHLPYPRSLHHVEIADFKRKLKERIIATYKKSKDPEYSPFLGYFDQRFRATSFDPSNISELQILSDELKSLHRKVDQLDKRTDFTHHQTTSTPQRDFLERDLLNTLSEERESYYKMEYMDAYNLAEEEIAQIADEKLTEQDIEKLEEGNIEAFNKIVNSMSSNIRDGLGRTRLFGIIASHFNVRDISKNIDLF